MNNEELKKLVREKYGLIANQSRQQNISSCCGSGPSCCGSDYTIFSDNYSGVEGYAPEADLGLGCGIPTAFADIKTGDTVVDLGSGAGNDCFVARGLVGASGKVIGIDFTPEMVSKARENASRLGYRNVEFCQGDIENIPLNSDIADVVISNCVLNLVPDKERAFAGIFRILKPGGHFSVSDVVVTGKLPVALRQAAEMYAGCISGAVQRDVYIEIIRKAGFSSIRITKEKQLVVPDDILLTYISEATLADMKKSGTGIFSLGVYAMKPYTCNCSSKC